MRAHSLLGVAFLLAPVLARSHDRPLKDGTVTNDATVTEEVFGDEVKQQILEAELTVLDNLHLQLRKVEQAIHFQEVRLAQDFGWSPPWQTDDEECDSLKCLVKSFYGKVSDAAADFFEDLSGDEEALEGPPGRGHHGPGREHGKHGKHGKGRKHHRPHCPGFPHHGWPHHGDHGNHTHGNHTFPPHPPPFCHCPPPPPDRPPHHGPPHHGPPFDRPHDGPPGEEEPPFDKPPHRGPPHHGPPGDDEPPFDRPSHHGPPGDDSPPHGPPDHRRPPPSHHKDHGVPPPSPHHHHGPPPHHMPNPLKIGISAVLLLILVRVLHIRFFGGKSCCAARREARRRRHAQRREFLGRLFFRGWFSDDETAGEEEKAEMLGHHVEEETTMEQEIASCRVAAEIVGDLVAAEEGRAQPEMQAHRPMSPRAAFAQYVPDDEHLPSYDVASSDGSSLVADGLRYTPGSSAYTPSNRSMVGGADDVLGDTKH